jgi:undecaprenyl diphosphate synthase
VNNIKIVNQKLIFPKHVAIIMDGNGRWATSKHLKRNVGHYYGGLNISKIVSEVSKSKEIKILSLFAFSCDNFKRPEEELEYLFSEPVKYLDSNKIDRIVKSNVIIRHVGYRNGLPDNLLGLLDNLVKQTKKNTGLVVNLCINYSAKKEFESHELLIKDDVDLLIRTGKRKRISDFLLIQSAYAELYFSNKYWPAFSNKDFKKALNFYRKQERTFGEIK